MKLREIGFVVNSDLQRAERSINIAVRDAAQLIVTLSDATASLGISPAHAQPAVRAATSALTGLAECQRELTLRVHPHLERVGRSFGLTSDDWGGGDPKPGAFVNDLSLAAPQLTD